LIVDLMSNRLTGEVGEARVYSGEHIGMRHEYKQVAVAIPKQRGYSHAETAKALDAMRAQAESENPGWIADRGEGWNSHRAHGSEYAISIRRWVDPDEDGKLADNPILLKRQDSILTKGDERRHAEKRAAEQRKAKK